MLALAGQGGTGSAITHVFETHLHNDYVTGGLTHAVATGAAYHVNAADTAFDRVPVSDGDVIEVSPSLQLRVMATPWSTFTHQSYVLRPTDSRLRIHRRVTAGRVHRTAGPAARRTAARWHTPSTPRRTGWQPGCPSEDPVAGFVDEQLAAAEGGLLFSWRGHRWRGAGWRGADHLAGAERLGDVIVGAEFEAVDAFSGAGLRGEHHDG